MHLSNLASDATVVAIASFLESRDVGKSLAFGAIMSISNGMLLP